MEFKHKTAAMKLVLKVLVGAMVIGSCVSPDASESHTPDAQETDSDSVPQIEWAEIDTDEALVATALMAAPEESREGCKVIGYNMQGDFVTLKEGDNEFICLADNPNQDGFSAACYHKSLEPFMARGRELKAQGKSHTEIFDIREAEVKAGKLEMGSPGATLHVYFGAETNYNPETSEVAGAQYRYVVYLPFATAESTGLPEKPVASNHPWIMNPGTHRAHIMISPKN